MRLDEPLVEQLDGRAQLHRLRPARADRQTARALRRGGRMRANAVLRGMPRQGHAVPIWDTLPRDIPCRVAYHAAGDTGCAPSHARAMRNMQLASHEMQLQRTWRKCPIASSMSPRWIFEYSKGVL